MGARKVFALTSQINDQLISGEKTSKKLIMSLEEALKELELRLEELVRRIEKVPEITTLQLENEPFEVVYNRVLADLKAGNLIEHKNIQLIVETFNKTVKDTELNHWKEAVETFDYDLAEELMSDWKL